MKVNRLIISLVAAAALSAMGCGSGWSSNSGSDEEAPAMKAAKLLIENNATDEDSGFQGFADGDPWNELVINGPGGEQILTVYPEGGLFDFDPDSDPEKTFKSIKRLS